MKQGWTYKKLGEVALVVSGSTPKTNIKEYWGEGHYWITPAELNEQTIYISKTERQITDAALHKTKLQLLPKGTVLLSSRAPIGKVAICDVEMYCNQGFKNCVCGSKLNNKYLFYFLKDKKDYLNSLGRGATFKEISKSIVEKITIPIPPLSTQLSIVSELDKINELIRLKKEQLKDYDNLAQSIFYEMFGDPAVNDKNWKVMKLGEICRNCDNLRKPITASDRIPGSIPYYGASGIVDYVEDYIFSSDYLLVSEDGANLLARTTPIAFSISGKTWVNNHAHVLEFKDSETQLYVEYLINSVDISNYITGAVQPKLNQAKLNVFPIPLPPHSLQQLFAQRIELIEQQKAEILSTIQDLETLLASRMQYWFD